MTGTQKSRMPAKPAPASQGGGQEEANGKVQQLFDLLNAARTAASIPPLALDSRLCQVAADHAATLAETGGRFRRGSPGRWQGSPVTNRTANAGYRWDLGGIQDGRVGCLRVLTAGPRRDCPADLMDGWMAVWYVRHGLMGQQYADVGIGLAQVGVRDRDQARGRDGGVGWWWVVVLGREGRQGK